MRKIYVIDACALIEAAHRYNMNIKTFSNVWKSLEKEIDNGQLISSYEIYDELKDDELVKWARKNKKAFLPLSQEIQETTKYILKKNPNIIKIKSVKNSNGDPFLIATAIVNNGVIVTNEGTKANGIPAVCKALNVECINLNQYLDIVLE